MNKRFEGYLDSVTSAFGDSDDLAVRKGELPGGRFAAIYLKVICSREDVAQTVIKPLLKSDLSGFTGDFGSILTAASLSSPQSADEAAEAIASGELLLLTETDGVFYCTLVNAQTGPSRSVQEPSSDVTVRGPKAGFIEDAETNLALLRKYIRSPSLRSRRFTLGDVSHTKILLCYVAGRASDKFINELSERISSLKATVVTDSSHLSMMLEGRHDPFLPGCGSTEKVDKAASKLMAGRAAIIVDGSPFVLTMPYVFAESIQASDDYLHTPFYATFIRLLRLTAFIASIFAPGILCALVTYDYADLAPRLYGIINKSREGVSVSFFLEILVILLLFELLREVGVRMPRTVGDAVGIVGSIILGNTAVDAGIVSSAGVITVAFAAVCAFITPAYMYVIVLFRIAVLFMSKLFGIFGLGLSAAVLTAMLCRRESFGVPYLYPLAPIDKEGLQDFVLAWPKKTLGRRERLGK